MRAATPGTVIIVACFSTGQFFLPRLHARGFRLVHVVGSDMLTPQINLYLDDVKEKYGHLFEDWIVWDGDSPENISLLQSHLPVAVIAGAEPGVELADLLADILNLPGNRAASRAARRNKVRMQAALRDAGIPTMKFHEAGSLDDLLAWTDNHGQWPVIVKPVKSAATQGVHTCRDRDEVVAAWNDLQAGKDIFGNVNATVLVEECLTGTEYVVNTVSYGGRHFLSDFWVYRKIQIPGVAPVYDYCRLLPYPDRKDPRYALIDYAFSTLDALEIAHGPAHTELMMTHEGPRLIETGARVMGGSLDPDILTDCIGHNQVDWTIDCHLFPDTFREEAKHPYTVRNHLMMKLLISHRTGKIRDIPMIQLLSELPSVYSGDLVHIIESSILERTVDMITIPGIIILKHPDESVLMADYQTIADLEAGYDDRLYELEGDVIRPYSRDDWYAQLSDELWLCDEQCCASDADLIWRLLEARPGDEMLDCPCGDGRIAVELARKGAHLVGIDLNAQFVTRARERFSSGRIPGEFLNIDMRELHFSHRFDAVVNWYTSFGYFSPGEDLALLRKFSRALKPGGRLLIDIPRKELMKQILGRRHRDDTITEHWDPGEEVVKYDVVTEGKSGRSAVLRIRQNIYTLQEYRLLLRASGLQHIEVYEPSDESGRVPGQRMVIVGHKPK